MAEGSSDTRVAEQIREALEHDQRLRAERVAVKVEEGVATLAGTVDRYLEQRAAAEDAWSIKGVREVVNLIQVQPERLRPDEEIAGDIAEALDRDHRVDDRTIVVNVAEGIARLSGSVATDEERSAAEEDVWTVEGVEEIANDLTLSADRRRPDREIEEDVRNSLDADARLSDPTQIQVKSTAGTLRLKGTVANAEERETAQKDAWYTAGVVYVENLLTVTGEREKPAAA